MARGDRPKAEAKKPKKTPVKQSPNSMNPVMPVPDVELIKKKRKDRGE